MRPVNKSKITILDPSEKQGKMFSILIRDWGQSVFLQLKCRESNPTIVQMCVNYAATHWSLCTYSFSQFDVTSILYLKKSCKKYGSAFLANKQRDLHASAHQGLQGFSYYIVVEHQLN